MRAAMIMVKRNKPLFCILCESCFRFKLKVFDGIKRMRICIFPLAYIWS